MVCHTTDPVIAHYGMTAGPPGPVPRQAFPIGNAPSPKKQTARTHSKIRYNGHGHYKPEGSNVSS